MASPVDRVKEALSEVRQRRPLIDHLIRMQEQYGSAQASQQAGAVTYFAFLSVFPILALAVFVIGYLAMVVPDADATLVDAVRSVLPGLIGNGDGEISLDDVQSFSGWAGLIGLAGVLYSGLGWLSALRSALTAVFETPEREQPNFVIGKLRDLLTLAVIGTVLLLSVAITGVISTGSSAVLGWLGLGDQLSWLVKLISVALGLLANSALFFAMFELLGEPHAPRISVWQGALLGAVGFEILKQASTYLLAGTRSQPAFQAFGIALILVVWINYFSRVVLYAAAFTHTSAAARRQREEEQDATDAAVSTPASVLAAATAATSVAPGRSGPAASDKRPDQGTGKGPDKGPRAAGSWKDSFVDKVDHADPDDVGEATSAAVTRAREDEQARNRLVALGAAATAAVAAVAFWRRKQ